jgi:enamine deaminase RidA (YjgF/YER057c/UK114 family)
MANTDSKPHAWNPPTVPAPPPSYKQVCVTPLLPSAKLITLAGQTGLDDDNKDNVAIDFMAQVKVAYENVLNCLKAVGASPRDIVHVRHYIVTETGNPDLDKKNVVDRGWADLWMEFMDKEAEGHRPPDTVLGVAALATKALLYEVEVSAIVNP